MFGNLVVFPEFPRTVLLYAMIDDIFQTNSTLQRLRRKWTVAFISVGISFIIVFLIFFVQSQSTDTYLWGLGTAVFLSYQLWLLWRNLDKNHPPGIYSLYPNLGLANYITLFRGFLIALLAGFTLYKPLERACIWIPAGIYTVVLVADYLDGFIARRTNHTSELGTVLENEFDSLGVLVASVLLVRYEILPTWYLLVGLARYLFLLAIWLRKHFHKPVCRLQHNLSGRLIAGTQMGFMSAAFWPIIPNQYIRIAGLLFSLAFFASFLRDWLAVTGIIRPDSTIYKNIQNLFSGVVIRWVPLFLRAALPVATYLAFQHASAAVQIAVGISVTFICIGFVGRLFSLTATAAAVFGPGDINLSVSQVISIISLLLLLMLGTGMFSLWKPEEQAFSRETT